MEPGGSVWNSICSLRGVRGLAVSGLAARFRGGLGRASLARRVVAALAAAEHAPEQFIGDNAMPLHGEVALAGEKPDSRCALMALAQQPGEIDDRDAESFATLNDRAP